ncbi:MAG: 50S ribosomal protein L18 [Candidatus Woykebacteria bacterium RBG_13_40_15]|uniref:Large ribosomal subunit protein uL18 n=1 Tax=Candidatus Woykebacteria bacterium RBG_13_40_15 TaxID=1802593 RepID=A0A1G1W9H3_9BACT|nr:MAG: 50S ribosomal protein L18 [Candidatus Woykebacteria bacterium RBG_13_40_15]
MQEKARERRKKSVRNIIIGTKERPRLNVFRSSKHIYASLIDDGSRNTIFTVGESNIKTKEKITKSEKAFLVGKQIANIALKKGIKKVVFDRSGYLYHGRVQKIAEGAREGGLKF